MLEKENWTDKDFNEMGWHDSYIYAISFPNENLEFSLDLDYIFEWVLDKNTNLYKFWISPCTLTFFDVLYLKIDFNFQNSVGINIEDINRLNPRLYPNQKDTKYDYIMITNKGKITFEASGFLQKVKKQPILSDSQVLGRKEQ